MMKQTIKIADLLQIEVPVDIGQNKQIMVRALSLKEMMGLFLSETEHFITLFSKGIDGDLSIESLGPFLVACPTLIAKIIACASNEPDSFETIEQRMPATVQLIALGEVWQLSVPDKKKAQELLSGVMAQLRKLKEKEEKQRMTQQEGLQKTSLEPSSSSSPAVIV